MKTLKLTLIAFAATALLFSCSSDDSDDGVNNPPQQSYPVTLSYDQMRVVDFKMWVGGESQNTNGMQIQNFISASQYSNLVPADAPFYSYTFQPDTVFENFSDFETAYTYIISNDTIHMTGLFEGEQYFYGSLSEMYYQRGMVFYSKDVNGQIESDTKIRFEYFTFENSSDFTGFATLGDMYATDTVIVYNQEFVYN